MNDPLRRGIGIPPQQNAVKENEDGTLSSFIEKAFDEIHNHTGICERNAST
jgi:hypothetical protein